MKENNHQPLENKLKKLKLSSTLDLNKKEEIVMALQKEARTKKKPNRFWIYFPTAAVIVLCGIFIYNVIIDNDASHNANDSNQEEPPVQQPIEEDNKDETEDNEQETNVETDKTTNEEEDEQPTSEETGSLSITEGDSSKKTILVEGMEEEELFITYTLEPYDIQFEIADYINNYEINDDQVRFYTDPSYSSITMEIKENTTPEAILPDIQQEYAANEPVEEVNDLPTDENSYYGVFQNFYDPPQGFYLYQIGDHVFVIQYEYGIEGGDGMDPRLEVLRKSIK
ncbi:putative membrane-anchored protein [Gracilibacillus halotolerans]|uniref:Putative membrane-anchored protein n=1 Tax=Gracilibacillus halotolerans TaxID=74386 RepID=A0A841RGE7_9BACI|nr:hypothetical protein [Gracilibacillus halotolerans]MBB6513190.1 putative membrane-anchored protein [Gracilibacillus halotolerans]